MARSGTWSEITATASTSWTGWPLGRSYPPGTPDRWVYSFGWDPNLERLADYSPARLVELVRVSAGDPLLDVRLGRVGAFSFVGGIAERYREGRAFLLGDAAHRVTPRGGTGLNTARRGRVRPWLETRLGDAGLGRRVTAGQLRGRAPAGRRAQPGQVARSDRKSTFGDRRGARRPRAATAAPVAFH